VVSLLGGKPRREKMSWTFTTSVDVLRRIERRASAMASNIGHEPIERVLAAEKVASTARAEIVRRVETPSLLGGYRHG
jgi:hypothetical protein